MVAQGVPLAQAVEQVGTQHRSHMTAHRPLYQHSYQASRQNLEHDVDRAGVDTQVCIIMQAVANLLPTGSRPNYPFSFEKQAFIMGHLVTDWPDASKQAGLLWHQAIQISQYPVDIAELHHHSHNLHVTDLSR